MLFKEFKSFDIFISYVVEDRAIVEALYNELVKRQLSVWYAKNELYPGAHIRSIINEGLARARYGVVILSPHYNSHWAQGELFVLLENKERCIPVLHDITIESVVMTHPELITLYCLNTLSGTDDVAEKITRRVKRKSRIYYLIADTNFFIRSNKRKFLYFFWLLISIITILFGFNVYNFLKPSDEFIESTIKNRTNNIHNLVQKEIQDDLIQNNGILSSVKDANNAVQYFIQNHPVKYHHEQIGFYNGIETFKSVAALKNMGLFSSQSAIEPPFELSDYRIYLLSPFRKIKTNSIQYSMYNMLPIHYKVTGSRLGNGLFEIDVEYINPIRYAAITVDIDYPNELQKRNISLIGVKPHEVFVFEKRGHIWSLNQIR